MMIDERTDAERPRKPKSGRVVVHAMRYFQPITKTCRNLEHAKRIAAEWGYVPDYSITYEEQYGSPHSFAAPERITDVEGNDLLSPSEVRRLAGRRCRYLRSSGQRPIN